SPFPSCPGQGLREYSRRRWTVKTDPNTAVRPSPSAALPPGIGCDLAGSSTINAQEEIEAWNKERRLYRADVATSLSVFQFIFFGFQGLGFAGGGRGPKSADFLPAVAVGRDAGRLEDALDVEPFERLVAVDAMKLAHQHRVVEAQL